MESSYLVFWCDGGGKRRADIVRIARAPHEVLVGKHLDAMVADHLSNEFKAFVDVVGVIELGSPAWNTGVVRDLALGDGTVGTLAVTCGRWRVYR